MSQDIGDVKGLMLSRMGPGLQPTVSVNRFWGGDHGTCVQITLGNQFVQLDQPAVAQFIKYLQCALVNGHRFACVHCGTEHRDNE